MHKLDVQTMVLGPISTNTYVVIKGEHCVIIDPAFSPESIIEAIDGLKLDAVLLTHGHFDHILAVNGVLDKYKEAKLFASTKDKEDMIHPGRGILPRELSERAVSREFDDLESIDSLDLLGTKWEVLRTPGHTKGSVCFYIEDEELIFSGDTVFYESYGRTDFEGGNFESLKDSIKNKIFKLNNDNIRIFPGHGESTTLGHEKKNNAILFD